MSDPADKPATRKTTRPKGEDAAADAEPEATAAAPEAAAAAPAPPPAPAQPATPAPASSGGASAGSAAAAATDAVSGALSAVRSRLMFGEQLAGGGALIVFGVCYLIIQFLLNSTPPVFVSEAPVLISVLLLLAVWVHRWGHHDFGNGYRLVVMALGVSLVTLAMFNFLAWLRVIVAGGNLGGGLTLVGFVLYWIGGLMAGYGAYLVWRTGR